MKKALLFILTFTLILLTSCDTTNIELENHDYKLSYNDDSHYEICKCGEKRNEKGHNFIIEVIKKSTCTEKGQIKITCECGYLKYKDLDLLNHQYGEYETTIEPTCISEGQAKRTCINCGKEEYKEINKIPHTPKEYDKLDSDCTHEGHIGGTYCSFCNTELSEKTKIDKSAHTFTDYETTIEATCTHIGQQKRTCTVCGIEEYQEIPLKNHTPVPYEEIEATCTHEGRIGGTYCSECLKELTPYTTLAKANHTYGDYETTIEQSCTHIGQEKRICEVCDHEDYKIIPMDEHEPIDGQKQDSTCIAHGHTEGKYCKNCGLELEAPEELPLGEHNYSIEVVKKEPNYNEKGETIHSCSVCGDSYTTYPDRLKLDQYTYAALFRYTYFKNNMIEGIYTNKETKESYKVYIADNNNSKHSTKLINQKTNDVYEYIADGYGYIETYLDDYRHYGFKVNEDPYYNYKDIFNRAFKETWNSKAFDYLTYDEENSYWYVNNHETWSYDMNSDTANLIIYVANDGSLKNFSYDSAKFHVEINNVSEAEDIKTPDAKYHYINNTRCSYCGKFFDSYSKEIDGIRFNYHLNSETNNFDFDCEIPKDRNVTILESKYSLHGYTRCFTTRYYEDGEPKSYPLTHYTYDSDTGRLTFHTSDSKLNQTFLLNDDLTLVNYLTTRKSVSNPYKGNLKGLSLEGSNNNTYYKIEFYAEDYCLVFEYKEVNMYAVEDRLLISYENPYLYERFGQLVTMENAEKHDGTKGTIYYVFNNDLTIDIYYDSYDEEHKILSKEPVTLISGDGQNVYYYFRMNGKYRSLHHYTSIKVTQYSN